MKFEVKYENGDTEFVEADDQNKVFDHHGYVFRNPIIGLRALVDNPQELGWWGVYERQSTRIVAYVNVFKDGAPVASVPLDIELERYQSVKKHPEVAAEKDRLARLFPEAKILVQKAFPNG